MKNLNYISRRDIHYKQNKNRKTEEEKNNRRIEEMKKIEIIKKQEAIRVSLSRMFPIKKLRKPIPDINRIKTCGLKKNGLENRKKKFPNIK